MIGCYDPECACPACDGQPNEIDTLQSVADRCIGYGTDEPSALDIAIESVWHGLMWGDDVERSYLIAISDDEARYTRHLVDVLTIRYGV